MKDSNMTALARFETAPTTISEAKMNIFAPVDKILDQKKYTLSQKIYEDDFFEISIMGRRLTQIHRDILDIALYYGSSEIEKETKENIPIRTFSLYLIQENLNYKSKHNQLWLREKFKELKLAVISVKTKKTKETIDFNIIRVAKHSEKINEFVLVFEELYFMFFKKEISIGYKELLSDILKIKFPQTKACIRYFLSFSKGQQINIDILLSKIGIKDNIPYYRKIVITELNKIQDQFNIKIVEKNKLKDTIIKYTKHELVQIYHPQKKLLK